MSLWWPPMYHLLHTKCCLRLAYHLCCILWQVVPSAPHIPMWSRACPMVLGRALCRWTTSLSLICWGKDLIPAKKKKRAQNFPFAFKIVGMSKKLVLKLCFFFISIIIGIKNLVHCVLSYLFLMWMSKKYISFVAHCLNKSANLGLKMEAPVHRAITFTSVISRSRNNLIITWLRFSSGDNRIWFVWCVDKNTCAYDIFSYSQVSSAICVLAPAKLLFSWEETTFYFKKNCTLLSCRREKKGALYHNSTLSHENELLSCSNILL